MAIFTAEDKLQYFWMDLWMDSTCVQSDNVYIHMDPNVSC